MLITLFKILNSEGISSSNAFNDWKNDKSTLFGKLNALEQLKSLKMN